MALGDEPVSFNRRSADLIGREIKAFRGRGRGELPLPKRRRNPGDGDASASVAGGTAVAREAIDAPTALTVATLPTDVAAALPPGVDSAAPCWHLGSGPARAYKLVASTDSISHELTGVYMIPAGEVDGLTLYNMAGAVDPDVPLQVKTFTLTIGGATTKISLIDVEKCA